MFIRQLNYLVALAKERHFGRAAAACHVSQPALSGAIRNIEEELGISIVKRGRRFEGFTADGELVLAWARRVIADCESLRQAAQSAARGPQGTLRMGAIPASLPLVPRLTESCLRRFPGVRHEIHTLSATEALNRLSAFEIDIALTYLDDDRLSARYECVPIFIERYVLVAGDERMFSGSESMTWTEAASLPLCLFTTDMQCRRGIDACFSAAGVTARPLVETDSMTALCAHVRRTGLFSILPHSALSLNDSGERLPAIVMTPELTRRIGLVILHQDTRPPVLDASLQHFRDVNLQGWIDDLLD